MEVHVMLCLKVPMFLKLYPLKIIKDFHVRWQLPRRQLILSSIKKMSMSYFDEWVFGIWEKHIKSTFICCNLTPIRKSINLSSFLQFLILLSSFVCYDSYTIIIAWKFHVNWRWPRNATTLKALFKPLQTTWDPLSSITSDENLLLVLLLGQI